MAALIKTRPVREAVAVVSNHIAAYIAQDEDHETS